jgi:hypothetical protein
MDSNCDSGACADVNEDDCFLDDCRCEATCCNDSDCKSLGGGSCQWAGYADANGTSSLILRACEPAGSSASGSECMVADGGTDDCAGGSCLMFPGQAGPVCTQPCCQTSDCSGIESGNWTCAPFSEEVGLASIVLLVCQPPPPVIH